MMIQQVKQLAADYFGEIQAIRHHLHANPELSFQEYETSAFVQQQLTNFDIPFQNGVADTGIVGLIHGQNPDSKIIALRADMDALPILEANDVPYKSKNEGVMHACGHDVHTSSLLGASKILNQLKDQFEGTIKLIFQPGEEKIPGGASLMIKDGVMENPKPKSIIGQHVHPLIPVGTVAFIEGKSMASADEIRISVRGKGGHAASPHEGVDPIAMTAQIITALQQISSRYANPITPTVLTLGKIWSVGGATNVIPNEVRIEGTFRTFDEKWRFEAHDRMKKIATSIAEGMGGVCDFNITVGYPFLVNQPELTQRCRHAAEAYMGKAKVLDMPIRATAEDFAYFSQMADGCFYRLGVANQARGITSSVHTPTFDIDEAALEIGMGLMTYLALEELKER